MFSTTTQQSKNLDLDRGTGYTHYSMTTVNLWINRLYLGITFYSKTILSYKIQVFTC